jgi:hypothetical protein
MASDRESVPVGVFASDLHKPSVACEGPTQGGSEPPEPASGAGLIPVPSELEVMEIEEDLAMGSDPMPDWRIPYLDRLVNGVLPSNRTKARRLVR